MRGVRPSGARISEPISAPPDNTLASACCDGLRREFTGGAMARSGSRMTAPPLVRRQHQNGLVRSLHPIDLGSKPAGPSVDFLAPERIVTQHSWQGSIAHARDPRLSPSPSEL